MTIEAHIQFLDGFNADLARLGCGARVAAIAQCLDEMEIVDLDGLPIGRIPTSIEPKTFAAFMLVVEQSFTQGAQESSVRRALERATH